MSFEIIRLEEVSGDIIEYEIDRMEKFYLVSLILGTICLGLGMLV
jgi:hypothetical protein